MRDPDGGAFRNTASAKTILFPAPGSKLQFYDPWDDFNAAKRIKGGKAPYQELLELAAEFLPQHISSMLNRKHGGIFRGRLDLPACDKALTAKFTESETEHASEPVTRWCNKYGLLGILPLIASEMKLTPVWMTIYKGGRLDQPATKAIASVYSRHNGTWSRGEMGVGGKDFPYEPDRHGHYATELLESGDWDSGVLLEPLGVFHRPTKLLLQQITSQYFGTFPKRDREHCNVPLPLSRKFWKYYSEPLSEFLRHSPPCAWRDRKRKARERKR